MNLEQIPIDQRKKLGPNTCCICLSGDCARSHDKTNKWAQSECLLFSKFGLKHGRKISASMPTTNIMEPCTVSTCEDYIFKYMMPEHFVTQHPTDSIPQSLQVLTKELEAAYNKLKDQRSKKQRILKHGSSFKLLIPYPKSISENIVKVSKQKQSKKYSIKIPVNKRKKQFKDKNKGEPKDKKRKIQK